MLTKEDILKSLEAISAPKDKIVTVHSSLKEIGPIEGGGQTLLDALVSFFTSEGGILFFPAMTYGNMFDETIPTLDLNIPYTHTSVLSKLAAEDPRSVRSHHPTNSVVAFGDPEKVQKFIECDKRGNTMTSPEGCYGEFYRLDGYILLLGVGQTKNTFIHCAEEMIGVENRTAKTPITTRIKHADPEVYLREYLSFPNAYGLFLSIMCR